MRIKETIVETVKVYVSKYHITELKSLSASKKESVSQMITRLIDVELLKDKPFDTPIYSLVSSEVGATDYADEGGKILSFMYKLRKPQQLDSLINLRFDMGVPDRDTFIKAFSELFYNDLLTAIIASSDKRFYRKGEMLYRAKDTRELKERRMSESKAKRYDRFQKLKAEFEQ